MFGWFKRDREARGSVESPQVPLSAQNIASFFSLVGAPSAAGVAVDADKAMEVPAVWAAVNAIASTIAGLPLHAYQRTDDGRQRVAGPVARALHDAANAETTSFAWRKRIMTDVLVNGGRSYTYIQRNRGNQIVALWPMDPRQVSVRRVGGRMRYTYHPEQGQPIEYTAADVVDIPWALKADGVTHRDPVHSLRDAIGLTIALEEYASKFFQNGGVPPLALEGPITTERGVRRASEDVTRALADARDDQRNVLVMPTGHTLKPIGIDPEKMQMEAARRFQVEEVARIYGIPPVFLQDLTHGTFSNTEQQDLHFVKHTLRHWLTALEQELTLKLFGDGRRYVEFNVDGLLRGDFKTRMEGYSLAVQNAIHTPNEVRARENAPDKDGGDELLVQGATVPLGSQPDAQPTEPGNEETD